MTSIFRKGEIILIENVGIGTETITINTPVISSNFTLILPDNDGLSDQLLSTGSTPGNMQWKSIGSNWKQSVKATSISDTVLSPAPATLDGVTINTNDRVLLKDQSLSSENGIYIKNGSGDFVRSVDAQSTDEASGVFVYTTDGTNQDKIFYCTDPDGTLFNGGVTFSTFNITNVMSGPLVATDNAITRYDGITGKILKDSTVLIDNSDNVSVPGNIIVELGNINLNSTSQQNITHTGGSGQNLVILSAVGNVIIDEVEFDFKQMSLTETGGGSDTITLTAPSNVTPTDYTLQFPPDVGVVNRFLTTGSTAGTMEWIEQSLGASPAAPDNSVQYRVDANNMGGSSNFSWNNGSQILTLNGSITGVTNLTMSGDIESTTGTINLSSTSAQNITHTGTAGNLVISSGSDIVIEDVNFSGNIISGISTLDMSGDLESTTGTINLSSTSAQNITHTGTAGNLVISSGSDIVIEDVNFSDDIISGISTLDMTDTLTVTTNDIILSSTSAQNITHTGTSGNLVISSGGNVIIQDVIIDGTELDGISTLDMTGQLTNTSGNINLTNSGAVGITHSGGPGQNLIISSGGNVQIEDIILSNGDISGLNSLSMTGDLDITTNDIILSSTSAQNITHTGTSGNLVISSGSDVVVEGLSFTGGSMLDISTLDLSGNISLSNTITQNITHTGGLGQNLVITSTNNNVILDNVVFNSGSMSSIQSFTMSGDIDTTIGDINFTSINSQNITHTGTSGNLVISSGGDILVDSVLFNDDNITAENSIKTTGLILQDPGAGTFTTSIDAGTPDSSYTVNLPITNGITGQLLTTDGSGQLSWISNPSSPSIPFGSVQFNNSGSFGGSGDLTWDDTNKILTSVGEILIQLTTDTGTPTLNGSILDIQQQIYTDNTGGPTTTNAVFHSFARPTLEATVGTTTTNAANVYIVGAPLVGTNQTITNRYAIWIDDGIVRLDGDTFVDEQIVSTGDITANSLTDGTVIITGGNITSAGTLSTSTLNVTNLSDGTATLNSTTLSGLNPPNSDNDAANKEYVDTFSTGVFWKDPTRVSTTGPITLSGTQTIDSVSLIVSDRVLVKDQVNEIDNGIYDVAAGSWTRSTDLPTSDQAAGASILILEGTTYAGSSFICNSPLSADTVGTHDLFFVVFTGAGSILAGEGLDKIGNTVNVVVDDITIEINSDILRVKDDGITNVKIQDNSIVTSKIQNSAITNSKLLNDKITLNAGDGLNVTPSNGEAILGGSAITLDIDSTILRTSGTNNASGMHNFTNTTQSTNTSTGAVVIGGGLGVAENVYGGEDLVMSGNITGTLFTDGTATLTGGDFTVLGNITVSTSATSTGNIQGIVLTDRIASISGGSLTNVVNVTAAGTVSTTSSITDGVATLSGNILTGLIAPTSGSDAANRNYVDSSIATAGTGLTKTVNTIDINVDDITIEINGSDNLQVKDSSITSSKLTTDSVTTVKILNGNVTNAKLVNDDITITAGTGLQTGGSTVLGGTAITLNIGTDILRTTSTNTASGIQNYTNTTESTNVTTGSVIISGGLGVDKNIHGGQNLVVTGTLTGDTLTDTSATLTGGDLTGVGSITNATTLLSTNITGGTLTDGILTLSSGELTGVIDINATGDITGTSFEDGVATLSGGMLTNLNSPSSDTDATTKLYVDNLAFGTQWKDPVLLATTITDGDLDLTTGGLLTIDNTVTVAGNRILVKNQTDKIENGIYDAAVGSWTRSSDMSSGSAKNFATLVEDGDGNVDISFVVINTEPFTIDTSELVWSQFSSGGLLNAGAALNKIGRILSVKVDDVTIEINGGDNLTLKDNAVTTSKFNDSSISTVKIGNGEVINSKLVNEKITITAGDGLDSTPPSGDSILGGSSLNFDVDNTVLDNTSTYLNITGARLFSDNTGSISPTTGAVVIDGGLGVGGNIYLGGLINTLGDITGNSLTDGTATINSTNLEDFVDITLSGNLTASGNIVANQVKDANMTITGGSITGIGTITTSGTITTTGIITNGTVTFENGIISGLDNTAVSDHAANRKYVNDRIVAPNPSGAMANTGNEFYVLVDDITIDISGGDQLQVKNNGVSSVKIQDNSISTVKINDGDITNAKLLNDKITITAGDGLQSTPTNGEVDLGSSLTLDVDNTVMSTTIDNTSSGIQKFTDNTVSSDKDTGAVITEGGVAIKGDSFIGGDSTSSGIITASTIRNTNLTISSGIVSNATNVTANSIDATTTLEGTILTDGTATLTGGTLTGVVNINMTGNGFINLSSVPDDRILFMDNVNEITTSANLTWDGTDLAATSIETLTISRTSPTASSSLWGTGTGNIDFGLQAVNSIIFGSGPMLELNPSKSVLYSNLTVRQNLSRVYDTTLIPDPQTDPAPTDQTYTASQVYKGVILRKCDGLDRTDTMPTAANLIAQVQDAAVGSSIEFLIRNTSTDLSLLTLATNTGVTFLPTELTIASSITNRYIIRFDNITVSSEAVTVYNSVSKDRIFVQCSFTNPTEVVSSIRYAQWGPVTGNETVVDYAALGYSGTVIQLVCCYSEISSNPISIAGGANDLTFNLGLSDPTDTTNFISKSPEGDDLIVWDNASVDGTFPATTSGPIQVVYSSTDRVALQSVETGTVDPVSFQVRCAIIFQLD